MGNGGGELGVWYYMEKFRLWVIGYRWWGKADSRQQTAGSGPQSSESVKKCF